MDRGLIVGLVLGAALILMGIWTGGGTLSAVQWTCRRS